MYEKHSEWKHWDFILLDLLSIAAAAILGYAVYPGGSLFSSIYYLAYLAMAVCVDLIAVILDCNFKNVLKRGYLIELIRTLQNAVCVAAAIIAFLFAAHLVGSLSRAFFFVSMGLYCIISYLLRITRKTWLRKHTIPNNGRSIFIVTEAARLPELRAKLANHALDSYHLAGIALAEPADGVEDTEICAYGDAAAAYIRENWVDEVLIDMGPTEFRRRLADSCAAMGITVHLSLSYLRDFLPEGNYSVEHIGGYDTVTVAAAEVTPGQFLFKRILDICGAIVGLLITGILTLILGPMIYIKSPGPIFFKQPRIGRNGKVFKMYKFRSMYPDAEERKKEFLAKNRVADGMMFKLDFDPRIIGNVELPDGTRKTGIGQFIRDTSLDEFPQFLNVLKGEMSLVGTRPPTLDEWEKYEDHHRFRMAVRPGITGMWQVSGRSEITDFEEVCRLDASYIANWTLSLDIKILFKTVAVVLKRKGSM